MVLLPVPADLITRLLNLIRKYPVTQQKVFDLQLVATMLGNGVDRIYTYNRSDFEQIDELEVVVPG